LITLLKRQDERVNFLEIGSEVLTRKRDNS